MAFSVNWTLAAIIKSHFGLNPNPDAKPHLDSGMLAYRSRDLR